MGDLSKDLLLAHDASAHLILVCLEPPTAGLLNEVHSMVGRRLRQSRSDCQVLKYEDQAGFSVIAKVFLMLLMLGNNERKVIFS